MSEATAAQQYFDPPDPKPTCLICDETQFCCGDPWCQNEEWDGDRGRSAYWHLVCYARAIEELEEEANTIPDGVADVDRIGELMTTLGVELVVKKEVVVK